MKMSRMEKYHNEKEIPKESKQYHFFKNVGIICFLIMIFICLLYLILSLTSESTPNNIHSVNNFSSSVETVSSIKKASSTKEDSQNSNFDKSSSTAEENDYQNIPQQVGSNQTFNSLQDAINYGKQNVANGTCGNYRVVNMNGKFRTELF